MSDRSETLSQTYGVEGRSVREIVQDILRDVRNIMQTEIRLARTEINQKLAQFKSASVMLAAAALCGLFGVACLVTTCIAALALVVPFWAAALIMGILLCGMAGGGFVMGRTKIARIDPVPQRTVQTLKGELEEHRA